MENIKCSIYILVTSWAYTLSEYYFHLFDKTDIYEIYATAGVPFSLITYSFIKFLKDR